MSEARAAAQLPYGDTQRLHARRRWTVSRVRKVGTLAIGYFGTGMVGLLLAVPPGYATAVWPPSGIALAGVLLWGTRVWPGIWLGSFLVNVWVAHATSVDGPGFAGYAVAASIAVGSTLQALLTVYLLRRWVPGGKFFASGPSTLAFAATVTACCAVASTWGTISLYLAGLVEANSFTESWKTWWLGDAIGVMVVAPVLLNLRHVLPLRGRRWRMAESLGALVLLATVTGIAFFYEAPIGELAYPLSFLPLPLLVWIACRSSPGGVALATLVLSAIAIVATSNGAGPFARDTAGESLLLLQVFTGIATLMALTLSAAVTGHKAAALTLRRLSAELEQLALTDELTGLRNRRGFLMMADQARRLARRTNVKCRLLYIDLDGLKNVNDTLGHHAGDELLADAARLLAETFRETDIVGRIGGDEFAVLELLEKSATGRNGSHRLQAAIDNFNLEGGRPYLLSMSVGSEDLPASSEVSLDTLLSRADSAMYDRKRQQHRRPERRRVAR